MTNMRRILTKVAGVTFENRQEYIAEARSGGQILLRPEPGNPFDHNAIAVWLARDLEGAVHVGYIPKDIAADIAPAIEGENLLGKVFEVTGGFSKFDGSRASYGLIIEVEIPDVELRAD